MCIRYTHHTHTHTVFVGNLNELNQRYTSSNTVPPRRSAPPAYQVVFFSLISAPHSYTTPTVPRHANRQHFIYETNTQTNHRTTTLPYLQKENKSQLNNTTVLIKISVLYRTAAKDLSEVA